MMARGQVVFDGKVFVPFPINREYSSVYEVWEYDPVRNEWNVRESYDSMGSHGLSSLVKMKIYRAL